MGASKEGHNWTATETTDGVREVKCSDWSGFTDFINNTIVDYNNYVFRGHANQEWKLEPTLDRYIRDNKLTDTEELRTNHLNSFIYAARGRRQKDASPAWTENDCWCIGQHYGLATPLLDWTESPYVAAYFAFASAAPNPDESPNRVIHALQRVTVRKKSESLLKLKKVTESETINFIHPISDENSRMINQRGLFSRSPRNTTIEDWIRKHFKGEKNGAKLVRIFVPNIERDRVLKSLNRMNVNHLSLFPDMYGAAKYCNMSLSMKRYAPVPERI